MSIGFDTILGSADIGLNTPDSGSGTCLIYLFHLLQ